MKPFFLLFLASFASVFTYSQTFKVTSDGLLNSDDSSKHYVVIHLDSLSAKELYSRSYSYIQHSWKNPDLANNGKIEGEFLHVKTFVPAGIVSKAGLGMKNNIDLKYSLNLDFKDGKIKYEIVDLEMTGHSGNGTPFTYYLVSPGGLVWSMYKKDGEIVSNQRLSRDELEEYFNNQLTEFKKALVTPAIKSDF